MKTISNKIFAVVLSVIGLSAVAQQVPLVSQYFYTPMLYNPAMTGKDDEVNIWLMDREQWTKVQGAPATRGGTIDAGLWKNRIGVGLAVFQDQTDIINRILIQGSIAGRVKVFKDAHIGIGLTPSLMNVRIDFQKANPEVLADPHLFNQVQNRNTFDLTAGLSFTWRQLIVGFSVPQILNSRARYLSALNATDLTLSRHYLGHVSYKFEFSRKRFFLQPTVLLKGTKNAPFQGEGNVMFGYKNIVWAGLGYRSSSNIVAMVGVGILDWVKIGYAFDYNLNKRVSTHLGGSHEVIVGVRIPYGKKTSPADVEKYNQKFKAMDSLNAAQQVKLDSMNEQLAALEKENEVIKNDVEGYKQKLAANEGKINDLSKALDEFETRVKTQEALSGKSTPGGNMFRLDNVYFETNSSGLKKESNVQLDRVVKYLNDNPTSKINIFGHTDFVASEDYNKWLSERRAKSVYDYLVGKGVSKDRLTFKGLGKAIPVASNETEEGRAQNRRVEIEIVK
jgi:type IX secretion system PorP/SprF family membrane protein